MAYDKVIDSAVLDGAMTATADAIREKAGSSDKIAWDEARGFKAAVEAIETGGGGEDYLAMRLNNTLTEYSSDEVTSIGNYAFYYCSGLTTVSFPQVTSIGSNAFYYCSGLTTVDFPQVTSIGNDAFYYCSGLTTVNFPQATSIGGSVFRNCVGLTTVNFPQATSISGSVFRNCSGLTTVSFPQVTSIFGNAFYSCGKLTTADFSQVTSIGNNVFYSCTSLTRLILRGETAASLSSANAFTGTPIASGTGYIYVPAALVDTYKAATNWSTYASQFRALEDYTVDGTITGALDDEKIAAADAAAAEEGTA